MADKHTTEKLLEGDRLSGKVTLFAKVTILPGDELSYHEHHGETEFYQERVCTRTTTRRIRWRQK